MRARQLVRQLDRIEHLRSERALDVTDGGSGRLIELEPSAYAG